MNFVFIASTLKHFLSCGDAISGNLKTKANSFFLCDCSNLDFITEVMEISSPIINEPVHKIEEKECSWEKYSREFVH